MKRDKLIQAIDSVLSGLENRVLKYDLCYSNKNVNLFLQVLLNMNESEIEVAYDFFRRQIKYSDSPTWDDIVRKLWKPNGDTEIDFFTKVKDTGMTREDLIHLAQLSNPKIVSRTKIKVSVMDERKTKEDIGFFESIFISLFSKSEKPTYHTEERTINTHGHHSKEGYVAYLVAWKEILEEEN